MNSLQKLKNYNFGLFAEGVCCFYLKCLFYKILERRCKTPLGEIDIIAKKGKKIIFIEVKARKSKDEQEVLTSKQKYRIINASNYYISKKSEFQGLNLRFDLIIFNNALAFKHIKNAW